jgi:hypothetical protein
MAARGARCSTCNALGHTAGTCPKKGTVGIPVGLLAAARRDEEEDPGPSAGPGTRPCPGPAGLPTWPPLAVLGPDFLSSEKLEAAVRCRPEVPGYLRCAGCTLLPQDPVWCAKCTALTCAACLAPVAPPGPAGVHDAAPCSLCPECRTTDVDNFHRVPQLSFLCDAWFMAIAAAVDPVHSGGLVGGPAPPQFFNAAPARRRG